MPVTPLHFGPALLVREIVGKKNFGIWSFAATQVAFDAEPVIRILLDLEGKLHETTHTPLFGVIYALLAIALCWRWEKRGAVVGAVFGSVSHLWLDSMYHSDVAEIITRYGAEQLISLSPTETERLCFLGFGAWLLVKGIRKSIAERHLARRDR